MSKSNAINSNASSLTIDPGSVADSFVKFDVNSANKFSFGVDATDNFLKVTNSTDPSSGTELLVFQGASITTTAVQEFVQLLSSTGNEVYISSYNTDNTSATSNAVHIMRAGGASGGDAFSRYLIQGGSAYSVGIDNSDSDKLKINHGSATVSPSTGTNLWAMTTVGERTVPLQPGFMAYNATVRANVTGNGTIYTIAYNVERWDNNSDYNNATYTFTAPVTGKYLFVMGVELEKVNGTTAFQTYITTTLRSYVANFQNITPIRVVASDDASVTMTVIADMDATDTCIARVQANGKGADTCDVANTGTINYFMGYLLG